MVVVPVILLMRTSYAISTWRARATYLASVALGVGWGAGVAFVQLVPGWSFIGLSQRSSISYGFFGAGSHFVQWIPSMLVQDVFGGNGLWGQPHYFSVYSFAEVSGYAGSWRWWRPWPFSCASPGAAGCGPSVTTCSTLPWARSGGSRPGGRRRRSGTSSTPSRSSAAPACRAATSFCGLRGLGPARMVVGPDAGPRHPFGRLEGRARWITLSPAIAAAALCVAMFVWGGAIVHSVGVEVRASSLARGETLTLALHLVVALAASVLLLRWRRSTRSWAGCWRSWRSTSSSSSSSPRPD